MTTANQPPWTESLEAEFIIRRYPRGIAFFGMIPASLFTGMAMPFRLEGFTLMHPDLTQALHAVCVLTRSEEEGRAWLAELDIRPDNPDWLRSGDIGTSSMTIFAAFTNRWDILPGGMAGGAAPRNSADFGRCHRLLQRFPEWRADLARVADACPSFAALIPAWDELDQLFEAGNNLILDARLAQLADGAEKLSAAA